MTKGARPFTSHVKMMALTLVLPHAGRWFYAREIQRITGIAYTPVRYAILDLEAFGLLTRQTRGSRQFYTIDKNFFLYEEYKRIVLKTTGLGDHLRFIARKPNDILAAFIYGHFAEGNETMDTPIEFCCISRLPASRFKDALDSARKLTLKEYVCIHLTPGQLNERRKDPAIRKALNSKKIFMIGNPEILAPFIQMVST